jgi:hypothetical protein
MLRSGSRRLERADKLSEDHGETEKGKEGSYGGEQDA